MKILLLKKNDKLGNIGDIVNVKNGYARNYLLPFQHAILATKENISKLNECNNIGISSLKNNNEFKLNNTTVIIPVKVKKNDELYGIINSAKFFRIIKKLKLNLNVKNLNNTIFLKKTGNYKIEFKNKYFNTITYIYIMLIKTNEY